MTTLDEDKLLHPRSYANIIERLVDDVRMLKATKSLHVDSLDVITPVAGDLVGATLWIVDPETGMTRGIITANPRELTGDFYQVFFNQTGDITFGVDADDGSLFAALGSVILNEEGITAIAGMIGGWFIGETYLRADIDNIGIVLDASAASIYLGDFGPGGETLNIDGLNQRMYTSNYTPNVRGMNLDFDTGDVEINNLLARGELRTFLLTSQNQMAVGGNIIISKDSGKLEADVSNVATTVNFGKAMTPSDWIKIQGIDTAGANSVEWMLVGTLVSGTTYNVTRNVDGSGANAWSRDTPFVVIGQNGTSRIELVAGTPSTIQLVTQGATWNAQTVQASMSTQAGAVTAGAGDVLLNTNGIVIANSITALLSFKDNVGATGKIVIGADPANELEIVNISTGGAFGFYLKDSGAVTRKPLILRMDPSNTDVWQMDLTPGLVGAKFSMGSENVIWAAAADGTVADGTINIINGGYRNIDTVIRGSSLDMLLVDAGLNVASIGGAVNSVYRLKVHGSSNVTGHMVIDGQASLGEKNVIIADDAVFSFTPPNTLGFVFVAPTAGAINTRWGIFSYRAVATTFCLAMATGAATIVGSAGALTGTTGTDGNITVSAHTDGKIYVENRSGTQRNFNIAAF